MFAVFIRKNAAYTNIVHLKETSSLQLILNCSISPVLGGKLS
jgi:hypothetical protein